MKNLWKNTPTLDEFVPELLNPVYAEEAEIAVVGGKPIPLDELPKLKGIFKCGVGTDNIPFEECEKRGIEVCLPSDATRDIIFEETANFAVKAILDVLYANAGVLETWTKHSRPVLSRKTVLLLGQGNIGRKVKAKLDPLLKVTIWDAATDDPAALEPLVREADAVSLHIPLLEETTAWFDAEKMSWMKDGAGLVNTARGPVVDEQSLLKEIEAKRIYAAFDVFWQEPYHGPLREHSDHFFMTPHIASTCADFLEGLARDLREFVGKVEGGKVSK
jgi:phosphoglycerate dehydrogenase-like enzyme